VLCVQGRKLPVLRRKFWGTFDQLNRAGPIRLALVAYLSTGNPASLIGQFSQLIDDLTFPAQIRINRLANYIGTSNLFLVNWFLSRLHILSFLGIFLQISNISHGYINLYRYIKKIITAKKKTIVKHKIGSRF
jgi:hypothetical protein